MLKAPFPYFGGKSKIAPLVWQCLGDVHRYIEPFFGSGAVLLSRPNWKPNMDEIVNDADGFICNVWRSIQFSPDEVAKWCDWPVNHADLMARKRELIKNEERLLSNLIEDAQWHDPVMAGYWIWAASCWIGSGLTRPTAVPHLTSNRGVNAGQRPHLTDNRGVNAGKRPILGGWSGKGVHSDMAKNGHIYDWMRVLSERLRYVKVVCGDWSRGCGGNWQADNGVCGIFFDPPYSAAADRDNELYNTESQTVAQDVARWAYERGKSPRYRIVLAGYYQEHEWLLSESWTCRRWSTQGGYSNQGNGNKNRHNEALFISPHCVGQGMLL